MTAGPPAPWLRPDAEGMLAATAGLGEQIGDALDDASSPPAPRGREIRSVVVAGMGGSAVAGEVMQAYATGRSAVPVTLVDSGRAPRWVCPETVFFAVSYSGQTEETLSATSQALSSGASVVAITTGGQLGELVAAEGGHVIGLGRAGRLVSQPRSAVGAMVSRLLLACEQLALVDGAALGLERAREQVERRRRTLVTGSGLAAELARRIGRTIPLFHGAAGLGAVAARRWKTQVNENAKAPAFAGVQPEVCHNEVCGFGQHGDVTRQVLTLVNLRTGDEEDPISRCFELFAELTSEALAGVVDVVAEGDGELARFFDLVMVGDFVSLHLAAREGIDPGPVPTLTELKWRLRSGA